MVGGRPSLFKNGYSISLSLPLLVSKCRYPKEKGKTMVLGMFINKYLYKIYWEVTYQTIT